MAFVSTQQTTAQNDAGDILAYGAKEVAATDTETICEVVAAAGGGSAKLNLSLPNPADWADCSFELFVRGRSVMVIEDQSAQFIDQPWKIPYEIHANDIVRLSGTNGSGVALRFAAYMALDVHEIENVRVMP